MSELTLDQKFELILKNISDTENNLSQKMDERFEQLQKSQELQAKIIQNQESKIDNQTKILKKQDARLERLEESVTKLIDGQIKLVSLVEKVLDVQDEQKDLIEALAVRSTHQDAEILRIKKAR